MYSLFLILTMTSKLSGPTHHGLTSRALEYLILQAPEESFRLLLESVQNTLRFAGLYGTMCKLGMRAPQLSDLSVSMPLFVRS